MRVTLLLSSALTVAAIPAAFDSNFLKSSSTSRLTSNGRVMLATDANPSGNAADNDYNSVPSSFRDENNMVGHAKYVSGSIANGTITEKDAPSVIQALFMAATPTSTPTSIPDTMARANSAFKMQNTSPSGNSTEPNLMASALDMMMNGLVTPETHNNILNKAAVPTFNNPPVPAEKNFYTKEGNAPFSLPEEQLRSAIQIPPTFTYGQKQPVLMAPGTGASGYETFGNTMGKLLATTPFADPVYISIPGNLLNDVQINAEFVAYALQYLQAMTNQNVAIVTWSQGSLDMQWSLKYWPSIRNITTDFIAISPDFHGTRLAYLLCTGNQNINMIGCTPAISQQAYNSRFINRLRQNGGDAAYVPTTTVYSQFDEIVQPQFGRQASGIIREGNGVAVSNNLLQDVCRGQEGAGLFLHEGVLYSSTAYALVVDALTHDGPGSIDRVRSTCSQTTPEGITDLDVVQVEALIVVILFRVLTFAPKVVREPELKEYATN
ncbi:Lipase B [Erysiphe necator]|uniref:Putative lipase b protein n=1 Tax=Uncinula necator TaxID=52586 RepID=A0A0B1P1Y8_UNCNE|nr:Lipase B [Erysiphe necator]KHJ30926.1 putative lipase b precursor protein [Erysiphe necator]